MKRDELVADEVKIKVISGPIVFDCDEFVFHSKHLVEIETNSWPRNYMLHIGLHTKV